MNKIWSLQDQKILVTGASSGIGRQICIAVSNMGGHVIATGRDKDRLEETISMLSGTGHGYKIADLTKTNQLSDLVADINELAGIVFSAGILKYIPVKYITEKHIDEITEVNYKSPMILLQTLTREKKIMNEASIVFISSVSGIKGGAPGISIYAASKAALIGATKVLALEYASKKIRVNCLAPGAVATQMLLDKSGRLSQDDLKKDELKYPLGYGFPEDIGNAAVFLLCKASRWITGTTITIDGGYSCK